MMKLLAFLVILVTVLQSSFGFLPNKKDQCDVDDGSKIDCGFSGIDEDTCTDSGCCWDPVQNDGGANVPWCFYTSMNGGFVDCLMI